MISKITIDDASPIPSYLSYQKYINKLLGNARIQINKEIGRGEGRRNSWIKLKLFG